VAFWRLYLYWKYPHIEEVTKMSAAKKSLWLTLTVIFLGLLLVIPSLAQETPGEPETLPEQIPGEPEAPAEEAPAITITATICAEIPDREAVGAADSFAAAVGKLYCHTLVEGAKEPTTVTHVWYHGERNMAEIILEVGSVRWRTWSSKKIVENWTGGWHVDILDENGEVLASKSFQIQ
jgi:hypothetical protein